jgi:hypothetical protein
MRVLLLLVVSASIQLAAVWLVFHTSVLHGARELLLAPVAPALVAVRAAAAPAEPAGPVYMLVFATNTLYLAVAVGLLRRRVRRHGT